MSEYAERFAENDIDTAVLRHLTDQDLKELGVSLGHRRKMLAAIGDLAGAPPAVPKPVAAAGPKAQDAAERRQVTVVFSDLVGSTALSASGARVCCREGVPMKPSLRRRCHRGRCRAPATNRRGGMKRRGALGGSRPSEGGRSGRATGSATT
jgi:hypothetical protein